MKKKLSLLLSGALLIGAAAMVADSASAGSATYKGPAGTGPRCGNTRGKNKVCDLYVCEAGAYKCKSTCSSFIINGRKFIRAKCEDSAPGC